MARATKRRVEKAIQVYEATGSLSEAAKSVGVSKQTVWNWLKRHGDEIRQRELEARDALLAMVRAQIEHALVPLVADTAKKLRELVNSDDADVALQASRMVMHLVAWLHTLPVPQETQELAQWLELSEGEQSNVHNVEYELVE